MSAKILVVDDSPILLESTALALEEAGHEVLTLDNPLSVASVVRRERPALMLIDLNMPTLTGDMVARIVSEYGVAREMKVVLYSDVDETELARRASNCGATGFIPKRFMGEQLAEQVSRFLTP